MEEMTTSFLVVFLLPFHVGGGAALGVALRRTVQKGFSLANLVANVFFVIWGAMFGGIPLVFGLGLGTPWLFLLQLGIFLGTIVAVALGYEWLRDVYSHPGMFVATFGLVFFAVGAALAVSLLADDASEGILFGLAFCGVGGFVLLLGVWLMLRNQ
jgi:hypothetical protein